jgi:hypothetical protein
MYGVELVNLEEQLTISFRLMAELIDKEEPDQLLFAPVCAEPIDVF